MITEKQLEKENRGSIHKQYNYSLCRSSCSVCPYREGLLKLLDHSDKIVPTLPEHDTN